MPWNDSTPQDTRNEARIREQNKRVGKSLVGFYVISSFLYILSFIIFSCIMIGFSNHGVFNDYMYNNISMKKLVGGYGVTGLVFSLVMFTRIIIAPIINYVKKHKYDHICVYYLYYILIFINFMMLSEIVIPVGIIAIPIAVDDHDIFKIQSITYQMNHDTNNGDNSYHLFILLKSYVIMLVVLCIISLVSVIFGHPFRDYYACCGNVMKNDHITVKSYSCCYIYDDGEFYSSLMHKLDIFDCTCIQNFAYRQTFYRRLKDGYQVINEKSHILATSVKSKFSTSAQNAENSRDQQYDSQTNEQRLDTAIINIESNDKKGKPKAKLNDEKKCVICRDNDSCMVLKPCKHCCLCESCVTECKISKVNTCPVCRTKIEDCEKIFV